MKIKISFRKISQFWHKQKESVSEKPDLSKYTKEERAERQRIYETQRDYILKCKISNSENYDKSILSLSSAFLGATITFIDKVVPLATAWYRWSIEISWGLFIIAIISTLVSFQISQKALDFQLKQAEDYYIYFIDSALLAKNKYDGCNNVLVRISGCGFVSGVIMLALFIILNISWR
jgi:hypothetical protein